MYTATNILVCEQDKSYTVLNRYNPKTHTFEGEYSLLHNAYSQNSYFLSRFLMDHRGHSLMLIDSEDERYFQIRRTYRHEREQDIERYMEEQSEQRKEEESDLTAKQSIGQLQLLVVKKMIEQQRETIQNQESHTERDTYVLLGQDFAYGWSVNTINRIVDFGNIS